MCSNTAHGAGWRIESPLSEAWDSPSGGAGDHIIHRTQQAAVSLSRTQQNDSVCVPMWVGGQAGGPHTPTNMVRGLGLVPGSRFLLTIHVLREEAMGIKTTGAEIKQMERQEPVAEWLPLDSGEDTRRD